jgi:hypothetical protein
VKGKYGLTFGKPRFQIKFGLSVGDWPRTTFQVPTQRNKWRRTLEIHNMCPICGNGFEDSFHKTVECTKAKALHHSMRQLWELPNEKKFTRTGKDWLLVLLDITHKRMHQAILLLLWRDWELRNDIYHGKGKSTIQHSIDFLITYANTWNSNPTDATDQANTD